LNEIKELEELLTKIFKISNFGDLKIYFDGGCCTQIVLMGAARPYIGQVTSQGEDVPPTLPLE
jgi:hypothetical protein